MSLSCVSTHLIALLWSTASDACSSSPACSSAPKRRFVSCVKTSVFKQRDFPTQCIRYEARGSLLVILTGVHGKTKSLNAGYKDELRFASIAPRRSRKPTGTLPLLCHYCDLQSSSRAPYITRRVTYSPYLCLLSLILLEPTFSNSTIEYSWQNSHTGDNAS